MTWQTIESAPKDGTPLLLCDPNKFIQNGRWCNGEWIVGAVWSGDDGKDFARIEWVVFPTHWQALPTPPQIEEA